MRRLPLLVLTLALVLALPAAAGATTYKPRIVGGAQVTDGEYPWQVAVDGSSGDCGGTLIADRYVLTAEHCRVTAGDKVRVGSYDWYGGEELAVQQVFRHEDASAGGTVNSVWYAPRYDVNVLRLAAAVADPKWLTLVGTDEPELWAAGTELHISGWGTLSSGGTLPRYMQAAQVPAVTDATCDAAYAEFSPDDMFCAGLPEGGVDTCQGDSGGPIISPIVPSPDTTNPDHWRLVGVTSWGYGCAEPDSPGVYARLGAAAIGDFVRAVLDGTYAPPVDPPPDDEQEEEVPADNPPTVVLPVPDSTAPEVVPLPATTPAPVESNPTTPAAVKLRVSRRCTRRRRCTFTITPTGPVASVRARVSTTIKRSCRRRGKRTTCKRVSVRTVRVRSINGRFTATSGKLRKGSHTLTLTPYAADGTRAATPKRYRFSVR